MATNHRNGITASAEARFFLSPEKPLHRQYEALRAFFVEGRQSHEVARMFSYSPGAFRVLCHEFRHEREKRNSFFQNVRHGPQSAPSRDRVRTLAVAKVEVTGFVEDIRPYIDKAAVMVVPIRIGSGTRLKILDAMAMAKPIVSTTVGCEGLNVENRKNILIADDPEVFANQVVSLLKDPEKRKNVEQSAVELSKIYDWSLIRELQEMVYQAVKK